MQERYDAELDELHSTFEAERDDYEDQLAALSLAFEKRGWSPTDEAPCVIGLQEMFLWVWRRRSMYKPLKFLFSGQS